MATFKDKLTGVMDDCFCDIESIDSFNNIKIYPHAKRLTERDFFRHYRVSTLSLLHLHPVIDRRRVGRSQ
ncbi:unnamed protein product [Gadus morhua 'NCC']